MPRLYLSIEEFNNSPLSIGLATQLKKLTNDKLLRIFFGASSRVDTFCRRRLGTPGTTTVDTNSQGVTAGSTAIPVSSTFGFDNFDEQAITIGTDTNQETILIRPGGVTIGSFQEVSFTYPFPGTLELDQPLRYDHAPGEPVIGCYVETRRIGSSNSTDQLEEAITQEAQIAMAHQPVLNAGPLSRTVFVRNYPIRKITEVETAYSFSSGYFPLNLQSLLIYPSDGYYLLGLGSPTYEGSFVRTTYIAGYGVINDDIKDATTFYVAHALMYLNPDRATGVRRKSLGRRSMEMSALTAQGQSEFEQQAESILIQGKYRKIV